MWVRLEADEMIFFSQEKQVLYFLKLEKIAKRF